MSNQPSGTPSDTQIHERLAEIRASKVATLRNHLWLIAHAGDLERVVAGVDPHPTEPDWIWTTKREISCQSDLLRKAEARLTTLEQEKLRCRDLHDKDGRALQKALARVEELGIDADEELRLHTEIAQLKARVVELERVIRDYYVPKAALSQAQIRVKELEEGAAELIEVNNRLYGTKEGYRAEAFADGLHRAAGLFLEMYGRNMPETIAAAIRALPNPHETHDGP